MSLLKKSLQHVTLTLESIDTYPTYRALSQFMDKEKDIISNELKNKILQVYQDEIQKEIQKVKYSTEWVKTIEKDI